MPNSSSPGDANPVETGFAVTLRKFFFLLVWIGVGAILLNFALHLLWRRVASPALEVQALVAAVVTGVWGLFCFFRFSGKKETPENEDYDTEEEFYRALTCYLQTNWLDAELILRTLLSYSGNDLEARLLLASLLRRTKRFDEALRELAKLERFDVTKEFQMELQRERQAVASDTEEITEEMTEQQPYNEEVARITAKAS